MLSRLAIKTGIASDRDDLSRDSDADFAEDGRHPNADRPSQSDLSCGRAVRDKRESVEQQRRAKCREER